MAEERSDGDPNSYSNPMETLVSHLDLHLEVDFVARILKGYVDLTVERGDKAADLFLDTRDLTITTVRNKNNLNKLPFNLKEATEAFGSKLEVILPKKSGKKVMYVRVEYETSPKARALQWLDPCQTAGKKHPYMFSQCQAINARSMVPCQDTPSAKATYSATIKAPKELTVLMSAISDGSEDVDDSSLKTFRFQQKVPIPSYLIAIVVGQLESRQIGPRSHVWSEKEYVDRAAEEFSDTEKMISVAEELLGEYVWEIYDLLVLPPSFAFGGMENPCLTFVTPTLLAGDKSLVDVIAHEISHSWTGNLVTNRNFEHFWLNEGFTMFVERKIIGRMHGENHRHFDALGGWKELEYTIEVEEPKFTKLIPDLKDNDPDDAFNTVPYEKGHTFLFYLENLLGGSEVFEKFLKSYIQEYQKQSIDTETWKTYLYKHFSDKEDILNDVDWNAWFYAPGMPPVKPDYDTRLLQKCTDLSDAWLKAGENDLAQFSASDIADFSSSQIQEFIAILVQKEPLPVTKIEKLNEIYKFNETSNCEIKFRWIRLCLRAQYKPIVPDALKFVTEQGRMKYVRPIYRDLYNWENVREEAIANYNAHSSEMMYVTAYGLKKDLHLSEEN